MGCEKRVARDPRGPALAENPLRSTSAVMGVVRISTRSRAAPVLFRKVALDVAAIVKNAGHLDPAIFAAAIENRMARLLHP